MSLLTHYRTTDADQRLAEDCRAAGDTLSQVILFDTPGTLTERLDRLVVPPWLSESERAGWGDPIILGNCTLQHI